jgi:hypothetical protein
MVGPLVAFEIGAHGLGEDVGEVVLPRPGGPLSRMWSSGSPRFLAAATAISRRSLTLGWPVKFGKERGPQRHFERHVGFVQARSGKRDSRGNPGKGVPDACGTPKYAGNPWISGALFHSSYVTK